MMNISYNKLNNLYTYIIFVVILTLYFIVLNTPGIYENIFVYITNSLVIFFSLLMIFVDKTKGYSARKMFYLFIFFFMGIAPVLQYKNGDQTVGGYIIYEITYMYVNLIILFLLFIFEFFYKYFYNKSFSYGSKLFINKNNVTKKESKLWVLLLVSISLLSLGITFKYFSESPWLLFFRGIEEMEIISEDNLIGYQRYLDPVFGSFIRPLSVVCCVNYLCLGKKKYLKIFFLLVVLVSNFPTSLSRLRAAAYYLPLLLLLIKYIRQKNRFVLFFSLGLLFVFPFLNQFRIFDQSENITFGLDFEMFRTMNFDSYQSFAFVVQNNEITFGEQLLAVLFFWVPRSIWPDKPYMSGKFIAKKYDLWFDQISMNYFGEGYLNAGIIGVVVFVIVLSYITAVFDKLYWKRGKGNIYNTFAPFYLFFIGIYFFFMRGDLMNGFSYTIALLFANYMIFRFTKKIYK